MRREHFAASALGLFEGLYVIFVCRELRVELPRYCWLPRGRAGTVTQPREVIGHVNELEPCPERLA